MLGLLDPAAADPAGHAHAATATLTDLEQLAERYQALYATANPSALLTAIATHVRMVTAALGREHTVAQRRRLHDGHVDARFQKRLRQLRDTFTALGKYSPENVIATCETLLMTRPGLFVSTLFQGAANPDVACVSYAFASLPLIEGIESWLLTMLES